MDTLKKVLFAAPDGQSMIASVKNGKKVIAIVGFNQEYPFEMMVGLPKELLERLSLELDDLEHMKNTGFQCEECDMTDIGLARTGRMF